jgi:hypothetical protein
MPALSQKDSSYTDLSSYFACTRAVDIIRVYCIWVSPSYDGSGSSAMFSEVFIAEEVDRMRRVQEIP